MLRKILIVLVVLVAVFAFTKDVVVKHIVQRQLSAQLGVDSEIGYFNLGILSPSVHLRDLKVYNPEGFEDGPMAVVPEIYIRYSPLQILRGRLYFQEIRLHLGELAVERNPEGRVNLNSLKAVEESRKAPAERPDPVEEPKEGMPLFIEELTLKAERVTYSDRTRSPATSRVFDINIDERYENVEDAPQLVRLVLISALQRTALPSMLNLPMESMKDMLDTAGVSAEKLKGTLKDVEQEVKDAAEAGREFLRGLGGALGGESN